MSTYNIHPLALSQRHYILAKQSGVFLPPLRRTDHGGRFELEAALHGDPWLARVDAGHFELEADLAASGTFQGWFLEAGHFDLEADVSGSPALILTAGRFGIEADLQAAPLRAYPAGRFALDADLTTTGIYLGFFRDAGRFELAADLSGTFHRDVWWADVQPVTAQRIYTCTLTGAADGVDDAVLPMSSFQFRLYDHGGSYLSVVIPNAVLYAPEISARLNGQIVIRQGYKYSDGSVNASEMARAGAITMRDDTGPRNSSLTITAGEAITFSFDPGVVKRASKIINRTLQADGKTMFRTEPIFGLFPGDAVEIDGDSYTVDRISVAVGKNTQTMSILTSD